MKITVNKTLDNDVCIAQIFTGDFSVADISLMTKYGEPQIDVGGLYSTGTKASVTGNVNLSAGYDFSLTQPRFNIAYGSGAVKSCILAATCADLDAIVTMLQSQLDALFGSNVFQAAKSGNYVVIRTYYAGAAHAFTISAGSPDALVILGLAGGTYQGSGYNDFVLPSDLVAVKNDSPFVYKADARDLTLDVAEHQATTWSDSVVVKIKAAMDTLRANTDGFTGETSQTY